MRRQITPCAAGPFPLSASAGVAHDICLADRPRTAKERPGGARHHRPITSMIAKAEIDGEHGAIIAGLEAFLSARAAELEAEVEKFRTVEGL